MDKEHSQSTKELIMIYDFTQQPPQIFIDEGDGHLVNKEIYDNLRNGNPVIYSIDENGHAVPEFNKEVK